MNDRANPKPFAIFGERPFSRILQDIVGHLTEIVRSEIRLARMEIGQDLTQFSRAAAFVVAGAICALFALGFILLAAVYALATVVAPWLAALIVGAGMGVLALVLLKVGRTKIKQSDLKPDNTIQSMQENVTWMKQPIP